MIVDPADIFVVIPTHGGPFLSATVASAIAQTFTNWELVIVDDGSTDGTAAIAAALAAGDPRIRVVTQGNTGIANARNRGLAAITSESRYVALLDHDDLWMPDTLARLRAALLACPSASAAHGVATTIDEAGQPIVFPHRGGLPNRRGMVAGRVQPWPLERPTQFANFAYDDCVTSMGSGLIRRSALDQIGGFDPRAEPSDDYDLWARLARVGEIVFINRVVLAYRVHGARTSLGTPPRRGRGAAYVRHKLIASSENTPDQRRIAIDGFRAYQRARLARCWSDLVEASQRRNYRSIPRRLAAGVARFAQYVHGRPWRWLR